MAGPFRLKVTFTYEPHTPAPGRPLSHTRYWNPTVAPLAPPGGMNEKLPLALIEALAPVATFVGVVSIVTVVPASTSVPLSVAAGRAIGMPETALIVTGL